MPDNSPGMPFRQRGGTMSRTLMLIAVAMLAGYYFADAGKNWFRSGSVARDFETMNTYGRISLPEGSGATVDAEEAAARAEAAVQRVNALMSPVGAESDIRRLNEAPAGTWVAVDPLTWQVVMEALRWHRLSGGAFDPTIGPVKRLFAFNGQELAAWPDVHTLTAAKNKVGADKLRFDREGMRLSWAVDGMKLDLGAIAKGFAADLAMETLLRHGVRHALVDIGGELRVLGGKPGAQGNAPWRAGIRHPREDDVIETLELLDAAVATSGDYERYFTFRGVRHEHIIDPRRGLPLTGGPASVTVIHPDSCLAADALATTLCVLDEEETEALLREQALGLFAGGVRVIMLSIESGGGLRRSEYTVDKTGNVTVERRMVEARRGDS